MSLVKKVKTEEIQKEILSIEEMYRMGLEASMPDLENKSDLINAHKWFNLAALQGNEQARIYRKELTLEMTADEIAEAQRRAREWVAENRGGFLGA